MSIVLLRFAMVDDRGLLLALPGLTILIADPDRCVLVPREYRLVACEMAIWEGMSS